MSVNYFISQYCQHGHKGFLPVKDAPKLAAVLKKIIHEDLPKKDLMFVVQVTEMPNHDGISLTVCSENIYCKPHKDDKHLLMGVVGPYWSHELRKFCKTSAIYEEVMWFFFNAEQYVMRSRMINITGSIALAYDRVRGHEGNKMRVMHFNGVQNKSYFDEFKSQYTEFNKHLSKKEKLFMKLFNNMNTLDPFINRIVFCFVRALKLKELGFHEETVTALDCVISVATSFLRERKGINISKENHRSALPDYLNLSESQKNHINFLYEIRCYFGAHPAVSKWWDFEELYDGEFEKLFEVVKIVIVKVCEIESKNRIVDKDPAKWSEWFCDNCMMLWDAVSSHRVPMPIYHVGEFQSGSS